MALLLCLAATAHAQSVTALSVTPLPDAPAWIAPRDVARVGLSRAVTPADGRIAVLVGSTDWSALSEAGESVLTIRPGGVGFTPGEHQITVYLVNDAHEWQEIGTSALRVLTAGGFEKSVVQPTVEVDVILVEGYKHDDIPKIVVNSDGIRELSPRRPGVIAVISDSACGVAVPVFSHGDDEALEAFVLSFIRRSV